MADTNYSQQRGDLFGLLQKTRLKKRTGEYYIRGKTFAAMISEMGSVEDCFVPAIAMDDKDSNLFCSTDSMDSSTTNSCSRNDLSEDHGGPLYHMGSLIADLPRRRGLSNFYGGKSQSFSSLQDVKCVEHLAKPEDSYYRRKKLKGCHEFGLKHSKSYEPRISSASMICKRPQKASTMMKKAASFFLSSGLPMSPAKHVS